MVARFKLDPSVGQFGLYTVPSVGSTDDSPLTDPLNNLDRVIMHPQLRYPGVVATLTGSLSLPAASTPAPGFHTERRTHTLGAHGQTGRPMIIGRLLAIGVGGASVPWCGTVCVQCPFVTYATIGSRQRFRVSRWVALGVQSGNVVAYETLVGNASLGPGAITIDYEILILDRDLSATLVTSGPTRMRATGGAVLFEGPNGTINSETRYLKEGTGAPSPFALSGGRTTTLNFNDVVTGNTVNQTTFKHSFGSGVWEFNVDDVLLTSTVVSSPAAAVNPLIKTVAI